MFVWSVMALIIILVAITECYNIRTGVPTIASFPFARKKILALMSKYLPASTDKPRVIVDLGSGNGQLARAIAKKFPGDEVVGIELSPVPWFISTAVQKVFGPRNLAFRKTDFWHYDCATADCIVLYLTENVIERMSVKLRKELESGAYIVANDTALRGDWQPLEAVNTGVLNMKVFIYQQQ